MSDPLNLPAIARHRTAMVRHGYSKPIALLVQHGFIRKGIQVFDYGCGQGDDLRALQAAGIAAKGWDPHFSPSTARDNADVVNLGFVLNVIESLAERRAALEGAWSLASGVLVVATMVMGQVPVKGLQPFHDGYVTSRGTFQKYFQHAELRRYIADVTGTDPVSLAPGIFLVFRKPEDEQEFLLERRRGARQPSLGYLARERRPAGQRDLRSRVPKSFEEVISFALKRGRFPQLDEMSSEACLELAEAHVSLARLVEASRAAAEHTDALQESVNLRREDLLVHHALGILNKTRSAASPSVAMSRDIRALFRSQKELLQASMRYLYALGDASALNELCTASAEMGLGTMDERGRLVIDDERLEHLAGPLRAYVGCATYLHGEPEGRYLLRLDPQRRRVKYFMLRDARSRFPLVTRATSVDLRRCTVVDDAKNRRLLRKADVYGLKAQRKMQVAFMPGRPLFEVLAPKHV